MNLGDATFNVDEYVSKLVSFMGGRHLIGNNDRGREDSMDWAELGRVVMGICRRPPTMGFMLGPLSVEKKERKAVRRHAERRDDTNVVRPQEVASCIKTHFDDIVERGRYSTTGKCYISYGSFSR